MPLFGYRQLIPPDLPEDVAREEGEAGWRAKVAEVGHTPVGEPSVEIHEPPTYIDESGAVKVLPWFEDEDGNEVPLPRSVFVSGEVGSL